MTEKNPDMTSEEIQTQKRKAQNIVDDLRRKWKNGELTEDQVSQLEALGISKHSRLDVVVGVNDLGTTHPDLAAQWHPTKNGDLTPQQVVAGSNRKVWWRCERGHEWEAPVARRNTGSGCPYCSGRFAIPGQTDLATTNPELASQWHPTRNGGLTPQEMKAGSNKKVWWRCERGHEWEASVSDRATKGFGCPYCANRKTLAGFNDLATTDPELASQWHPTRNGRLTPQQVTAGTSKKVWWRCGKGHEWEAPVARRNSGSGCPYCVNKKVLPGFNDLATTDPDLAAQWHPTKNGDLTPQQVVAGSHRKVWWCCEHGHEWDAAIVSRVNGKGCPHCLGRFAIPGQTDLATTNPELASQWHPTRNGGLTPQEMKAGSNKKVWWRCERGHEWEASVSDRAYGKTGCPYCSNKRVLVGYNDLATTDPDLAAQWHPTKNGDLTPQQVVAGSNKKVWWLGPCGHEWIAAIVNCAMKGANCPICARSARKKKDDQR